VGVGLKPPKWQNLKKVILKLRFHGYCGENVLALRNLNFLSTSPPLPNYLLPKKKLMPTPLVLFLMLSNNSGTLKLIFKNSRYGGYIKLFNWGCALNHRGLWTTITEGTSVNNSLVLTNNLISKACQQYRQEHVVYQTFVTIHSG